MPTYTFAASGEVVRYLGATPVLVDVDPDTLNIDLEQLRSAVKSDLDGERGRPRAVIPVHFAGVPCDMEAVWDLAREYDLAVVEDAAHAFPAWRDVADHRVHARGRPGRGLLLVLRDQDHHDGRGRHGGDAESRRWPNGCAP